MDMQPRNEDTRNRRTPPGCRPPSRYPECDLDRRPEFSTWPSLPLLFQSFERFEDTVGAGIDCNGRQVAPSDNSILVDDKQGSIRNAGHLEISAIRFRHRALVLKVGDQRKVQVAILGKSSMAPYTVDGYSQQLRFVFLELRKYLVVECHLVAANRAPIGGIKNQNHGFAPQFAKRKLLIGRHGQGKIGRRGSRT